MRSTIFNSSLLLLCLTLFSCSQSIEEGQQVDSDLPPIVQIMGMDLPDFLAEEIFGYRPEDIQSGGDRLFIYRGQYLEIYSEPIQKFAGIDKDNIYLRTPNSEEKQVLVEGDQMVTWNVETGQFSPDGSHLAAYQIDYTGVPTIMLRPNATDTIYKPYVRTGEPIPSYEIFLINTDNRNKLKVSRNSADYPYVHIIDWHQSSDKLYLLQTDRLMKKVQLLAVDASSGESKVILSESDKEYMFGGLFLQSGYTNDLLRMDIITFLEGSDQFIWKSERSGSYQFYLYDIKGNLIKQLTNADENGLVNRLAGVDEDNDWLYYIAQDNRQEPYKESLYRTALNGAQNDKVLEAAASIIAFDLPNSDTLRIINASLKDFITREEFYTTSGQFIKTGWSADMERAKAIINSEVIEDHHLADDEETLLRSILMVPNDLDRSTSHPIIEVVYPAAHNRQAHQDFRTFQFGLIPYLEAGFIVAIIDGRPSADRSRAFQHYNYGRLAQVEMADHAYVMQALFQKYDFIDREKVGVTGASLGGHHTLKALALFPDLYKVGVAAVANADMDDSRRWAEPFMGCFPQDCPDAYKKSAILNKLHLIKGPLLLGYGTYDDGVPIAEGYKVKAALEAARNQNFVFKEYLGATHMLNQDFDQATISFFQKHLQD